MVIEKAPLTEPREERQIIRRFTLTGVGVDLIGLKRPYSLFVAYVLVLETSSFFLKCIRCTIALAIS